MSGTGPGEQGGAAPGALAALLTPVGERLLERAAREEAGADALRAATRLRAFAEELAAEHAGGPAGHSPADAAAAALTQARLRARAREKFGARADRMFFTPNGLEQATRAEVARHRAARFASVLGPGAQVADLCCGIGADAAALAEAGLRVDAVDADPETAAVAAANFAALGVDGRARARVGTVGPDWEPAPGTDAVFCDPARRGRRGRVFDPDAYSPAWDTVERIASAAPAACVKAAPGLPYERIPEGVSAEWVSVGGDVKEAALWFGGAADGAARRATLLRGGRADTLAGGAEEAQAPVGGVGRYLYEPDGAVVRAHLVAEAAERVGGSLLDPRIAYIASDEHVETPFCRAYEVHEAMPFSLKRLRAAVRARGAGTVTIKKRGSAVDVERLRRDLRPSGPGSVVVVLTRIGEKPFCLLCSEVSAAS
ncbi:SAM-dependent methyltransferase [Nocardiopsis sp. RSe5-2]|uniref:SAM-dependent methyltransferase n=1 Tax=Nocardiopsis endophytica TaxID=3018445 RepID=A0ABT4U815_9ACTN|nr:SAM-dependent methyltransferase [Nocardiopsis endophytica]MDA2812472.1 SAM-dependent methyltransferase [Nocardiopsis endophytica]